MRSPYFNSNVGQGWGPQGSAIQDMLARDWQASKEGFNFLGKMGGAIGGGVVGGIQAYNNPGVYGSKTIDADGVPMQVDKFTPGQAARKGFFQNFASIYNGGSGGDGASGIAGLIGGGKSGGTPNFKQLQQGGKAADSFREMIKIGMPLAGEQEANVFGTDDEWKTLSATEKFSRVGQMFQAQQFQAAQLAYKRGLQDYAAQAQQMAAAKQAQTANQQIAPWLQSYAAATTPTPGVPEQALSRSAISTLPPTLPAVAAQPGQAPLQAAATASRNYPLATSAPQFDNTLSALSRAQQLAAIPESGGPPQILPGPFPNTKIVTDARGRSTPQVVSEQKPAEGYIEVPDPNDPVYGPKIKLPLSQAMKDYPHLLERLKPGGGKGEASTYKTADDVKAALKAGKLKKEDAVKILKEQFGYQ